MFCYQLRSRHSSLIKVLVVRRNFLFTPSPILVKADNLESMAKYRCHKGRDIPSSPEAIRQSAQWDVLVYQSRENIRARMEMRADPNKHQQQMYECRGWKTTGLTLAKEQGAWRIGMGPSDKAVWEFGAPVHMKWCYRVFYALQDQHFSSKKEALECINLAGQTIDDQLVEEGFQALNHE
jgi:hypothetical protein